MAVMKVVMKVVYLADMMVGTLVAMMGL